MRRVFIALIKFYRRFISPALPPTCRFTPTCSEYGIKAYERHGAVKGSLLLAWRLLRCGPWHPGGYDPVPEKGKWKPERKENPEENTGDGGEPVK